MRPPGAPFRLPLPPSRGRTCLCVIYNTMYVVCIVNRNLMQKPHADMVHMHI